MEYNLDDDSDSDINRYIMGRLRISTLIRHVQYILFMWIFFIFIEDILKIEGVGVILSLLDVQYVDARWMFIWAIKIYLCMVIYDTITLIICRVALKGESRTK